MLVQERKKKSSQEKIFCYEDGYLLLRRTKQGVSYERYKEFRDRKGKLAYKKVNVEEETLWLDAFEFGKDLLDEFEIRRKPVAVGMTAAQFVEIKRREENYGMYIDSSEDYFFGFLQEFSKNSSKKYRLLVMDFLLYSLDHHFEAHQVVNIKRIEMYVENCILRKKNLVSVLETIATLKHLCVWHGVPARKTVIEEIRKSAIEALEIKETLFESWELNVYDKLFRKVNENRQSELKEYLEKEGIIGKPKHVAKKEAHLGFYIAARRTQIRVLVYNLIIENFLLYTEIERIKKEHLDIKHKTLFIEEKNHFVKLSDELTELFKQFLTFRELYDEMIYEEKFLRAIMSRSRVKLSPIETMKKDGTVETKQESLDWKELLTASEVKDIESKFERIKEIEENRAYCREKEIKCEHEEGLERKKTDEIYQVARNSKKRRDVTKETFIDTDYVFVSINSGGTKAKGLRPLISRFVEKNEIIDEIKKIKEEGKDSWFEKPMPKEVDKERDEILDAILNLMKKDDKTVFTALGGVIEEEEEEIEETISKKEQEEYTEVRVKKRYTLIRKSAIEALKLEKQTSLGEIERKIRKKF